jgi:hypothetical protein
MLARSALVLVACLAWLACESSGSGTDVQQGEIWIETGEGSAELATGDWSAELAPGEVDSHDLPPELPPADAQPDGLPPADIVPEGPPVDVLPENPPLEVGEDTVPELVDEHCPPPTPLPTQCEQVSYFECGFMASCTDGVIHAEWHVHHFCSPNDAMEDIIGYWCEATCPHGCRGGDYYGWPPDGMTLLSELCAPPLCQAAGGQCVTMCNQGGMAEYVVEDAGCQEGTVCCVPQLDGCLGLGGGFLDMDTEGKCCEGLVAASDCDLMPDGSCSCPKCPCYLCLPCGDGVCGPFEHACNCPDDCSPKPAKLPGSQSECQGSGFAPSERDDGAGIATLTVNGSTLELFHEGLKQNCCAVIEVWGTLDPAAHAIRLEEKPAEPYTPCFCECFFTVTAELPGIPLGTWTVTLYNQELGYDLMVQEVTVQ